MAALHPEQILVTPDIQAMIAKDVAFELHAGICLAKHNEGIFGTMHAEDVERNERNIREGRGMIMSSWPIDPRTPVVQKADDDTKAYPEFWIITRGDQRAVTILLPGEY